MNPSLPSILSRNCIFDIYLVLMDLSMNIADTSHSNPGKEPGP